MILSASILLTSVVFINAAPLQNYRPVEFDDICNKNVGEQGKHFEGDMVLSKAQYRAFDETQLEGRNGLKATAKRWPARTVVYHIVKDDFDEEHLKLIENGMNDISNKSCLKFRRRENADEHAVIIQGSDNGCFSNVGFTPKDSEDKDDEDDEKQQILNLAKGCFSHGTIVHEMLHTIGFYHMQSTFDRDDYVDIVWDNIKSGLGYNFKKYTVDTVTDFGVPYDYDSVMHYPADAFSKNGNKTIVPKQENVKIGQRVGLSEKDILKLNRMYCEKTEIESNSNEA